MSNAPRTQRTAEILLVEDSQDDVFLVEEAFHRTQCKMTSHLHAVGNGKECLAFLRKEDPYGNAPTPDLILLDINMPVMDGRQTLAALAADPKLQAITVVVLTTSASEQDIKDMYALGCRSYVVKPVDFDDFQKAADLICSYWFGLVALPTAKL